MDTNFDELLRLKIKTYVDVAATTLMVYDYLLTMSSEVDLVWPSDWNFVKVLFLLTRYMPICDVTLGLYKQMKVNISARMCHVTNQIAGWMLVFGIIVAEVILVVRTWAIWGRGSYLAVKLGIVAAAAGLPVMIIEGFYLNSLVFSQHPEAAIPGCLSSGGNAIIGASFVIVIVFETFVLILTLIKGYQRYKDFGNQGFVSTLFLDGIVFYIYLLIVSVVNLIVIAAAPRDSANLLTVLQRVLHSSLSSRVLINLREARRREQEASIPTLSDVDPVMFLPGDLAVPETRGEHMAVGASTGTRVNDRQTIVCNASFGTGIAADHARIVTEAR